MLNNSLTARLFIRVSIISDVLLTSGAPFKGRQKSLHLFPCRHSIFCIFKPTSSLKVLLLLMCPFTLSFHLPSGLPLRNIRTHSLSYTLFYTISSFFILSVWPNHLRVFFFTHSTTPYFTPFAHVLMQHLSHMPSLLSTSHIVAPYAPLRYLISTARPLDYCTLFHFQVSDSNIIVGRKILFIKFLFTSMETFFTLQVLIQ